VVLGWGSEFRGIVVRDYVVGVGVAVWLLVSGPWLVCGATPPSRHCGAAREWLSEVGRVRAEADDGAVAAEAAGQTSAAVLWRLLLWAARRRGEQRAGRGQLRASHGGLGLNARGRRPGRAGAARRWTAR
jgi:hypothetical protein